MDLKLNSKLGNNYKSNSQKSKNITEPWLLENFNCPFCKSKLIQYGANNKCADYYCKHCDEDFELKSKKGKFSKTKITGSEYYSTVNKLNSRKPHWIFLERNDEQVTGLTFIPKYFFYDEMIEKRKELSEKAKRSGWNGSLIHIDMIPSFAKIQYVRNGKEIDNKIIKYKLMMVDKFKNIDAKNKGWKLLILSIIDNLPENIFSLNDLYEHVNELKIIYPDNKNITAKIREMLQLLRNEGYVNFLDSKGYNGLYQKLF